MGLLRSITGLSDSEIEQAIGRFRRMQNVKWSEIDRRFARKALSGGKHRGGIK